MQMFWKLLCALVLLLVLGVFSGVDARVEPPQGETNPNVAAAQHDEGKGLEKFLVSFSNNANDEHFKKTEEWIIQNNLEITETVNESYIKFLVAKMSKADGTTLARCVRQLCSAAARGEEGRVGD